MAQVDAVRAVGPDDVELGALAGDQDVRALAADALDLQVALVVADAVGVGPVADDRDQVLRVRALALVLEARDPDLARVLIAGRVVLLVVARAGLRGLG